MAGAIEHKMVKRYLINYLFLLYDIGKNVNKRDFDPS